jgi:GAF domain
VTGRALLECATVQILDAQSDPEYKLTKAQKIGGYRAMIGAPLLREGTPIGVFGLARHSARPFTDKQIELLTTFADQAVIAIENVRLFGEVQARTRELTQSVEELRALGDVTQAVSSTLDLQNCSTPSLLRRRSYPVPIAREHYSASQQNRPLMSARGQKRRLKPVSDRSAHAR